MNKFSLLIVVIVASFAALIYFTSSNQNASSTVENQEVLQVQADDHVQGNREAEVVLVEYADLECPACAAYHPLVKAVVDKYGDKIAVVYRHFPLPMHNNAQTSAQAAEAAANQGEFFAMSDALFANQSQWSGKVANVSLFETYAEGLGLDMEQYQADVTSQEVKDRVQADLEEARMLGVNATPTFYLQGEKLSGMSSLEDFSRVIDAALAQVEANQEATTTDEVEKATSTATSS